MSASFDAKYIKFALPSNFGAEYTAVHDAMTTKPSAPHATAQNAFVVAAIAHSYWSLLQVFHFYAQDANGASEALINWKTPGTHNGTNISATAWTTLQGYTGDGAEDAINMNYNPSTQGGLFTRDDASFGCYIRSVVDETLDVMHYGGSNNRLIPHSGGGMYTKCNFASNLFSSNASSQGLFSVRRPSSTDFEVYRNGSIVDNYGTANSIALPNNNFYAVGGPDGFSFSTAQLAMAYVGGSMSATQISDFYTDFQALMTALGTQV